MRDLLRRRTGNLASQAGAGAAVEAAFFLVWINLAVGMIVARALFATALAQALVAVIIQVQGWVENPPPGPGGASFRRARCARRGVAS
jgi:hypothetical protein